MPVIDKFREKGIVVMGKVESGTVCEGDSLLIMPNKVSFCFFSFLFLFFSFLFSFLSLSLSHRLTSQLLFMFTEDFI